MRLGITLLTALVTAAVVAACGSDDEDAGSFEPGGAFGGTGGGAPGAGNGGSFGAGGSGGGGGLPPEVEINEAFELPHAGEHYVYVANPETDNVAVIDAATLQIHVAEAGDEPTFLQTLAGKDAAIVLNVGSADATILRTTSGISQTTKVNVQPGSNAIAVSPDGNHAVVYYDPTYSTSGDRQGSFQDVTVIALSDDGDAGIPATVGFRPSAVFFQNDGSRAFLVTEDGVSVLDFAELELGGGGIARTVPLGEVGIDATLDVSVTPDGSYALARQENDSVLRLVDLESGSIRTLDLALLVDRPDGGAGILDGGPSGDAAAPPDDGQDAASGGSTTDGSASPILKLDSGAPETGALPLLMPAAAPVVTDLDLAPTGDYALAVVRDSSTVLRLPIPGAFENAASVTSYVIEGELIGSVTFAPGGEKALLFTTVVDANERITILKLDDGSHESVQLRKAIRSVAIAPDGEKALVIHRKLPGDPADPTIDLDTRIDRSYGYSLVELTSGFAKLEVTPADLGPFAIVPDGSTLFVLLDSETLREVQRANLSNFFVDRYTLGSPPISVGAVPATNKVFVGQEHPDGRIAFIDWATGEIQSVTGFELNSRIRE